MKREFLQNFKVGDTPLPKEIIDAIMAENGADIEAAKKPFADYETIKGQLTEANKTIDSFKDMDIDTVRREANDWKTKYEQERADSAAKLADLEFNGRLTAAITAAKGRNAKAIAALLDGEALKGSKNQEADIKTALEGLQKENGYLFDTESTPPLSGAQPAPVGGQKIENYTVEELGKLSMEEYAAYRAKQEGFPKN